MAAAAIIYSEPTVGMEGATHLLHVHANTVLRLVNSGEIPGTKIGKEWVFVTEDLVAYVREKAKTEQRQRRAPKRTGGGRRQPAPSHEDLVAEMRAHGIEPVTPK